MEDEKMSEKRFLDVNDVAGYMDISIVNGKPHTWSKKSAALAGGDC